MDSISRVIYIKRSRTRKREVGKLTVDAGLPPHFVIAPAIPPQIASVATFKSWLSILLLQISSVLRSYNRTTYSVVSVHVVPVTAAGLTLVFARIWRTSRFWGEARMAVAERVRRRARMEVGVYISAFLFLVVEIVKQVLR